MILRKLAVICLVGAGAMYLLKDMEWPTASTNSSNTGADYSSVSDQAWRLAADCRASRRKADEIMQSWIDAGVVMRKKGNDLEVEDSRWEMTPHDGKVSIGIALYCQAIRQTLNP